MSNRIRGLTLLELLVALAIAGIVLSWGPAAGVAWMAERDLRDRADALLHALDRARSEAVKRGVRVDVCPAAGGECPGLPAAWEGGWTIVARTRSQAATLPAMVIAREPAARRGITIRGNRPVADYVSYTSLGYARRIDGALQMGTFATVPSGYKAAEGHSRQQRTRTRRTDVGRIAHDPSAPTRVSRCSR